MERTVTSFIYCKPKIKAAQLTKFIVNEVDTYRILTNYCFKENPQFVSECLIETRSLNN